MASVFHFATRLLKGHGDPQGEEEELPSAPSVEETVEELARSEDVPVEEVKPLTLDELEAIRQQA